MADHSIQGKVVLIAGGAKNLGGLIARDLAAHGASAVAIHYNSDASKADADATVAAIEAGGAKAVALQGDLTTADAVEPCSRTRSRQWAVPTSRSTPSARC
ncbi:NAD(P)-dependent dehydrogenase (short-subunit alcohol dehydrogenase family) [Luteimonas terrae]|uniref:NAD(P)-dependent dehydrogenase (Short-subunit alcohol dehydrogenase family) n=1 Tax=Luteimonas terrae TaxID=1530191 RepID=A0ABU1Y0N9_9GAMM|nr:NAD(P)-dependent dehydrogenase (short-subunit alcohol dehydrogenase family) [Luteimonas terrae]